MRANGHMSEDGFLPSDWAKLTPYLLLYVGPSYTQGSWAFNITGDGGYLINNKIPPCVDGTL